MSTFSNATTVIYDGEEIDFDKAINTAFTEVQEFLNDIHVKIRELSQVPEQDSDYMVAMEINHVISNNIDGITGLQKELKSVSKQVLGKPPKDLKAKIDTLKKKWMEEKKDEKKDEKKV